MGLTVVIQYLVAGLEGSDGPHHGVTGVVVAHLVGGVGYVASRVVNGPIACDYWSLL